MNKEKITLSRNSSGVNPYFLEVDPYFMDVFRGECNFVEFFKVEAVKGLNRGGMDVIQCNSPINIVSCCSPYKQQSGMGNDNSITNNIINFPLFPVLFYKQQWQREVMVIFRLPFYMICVLVDIFDLGGYCHTWAIQVCAAV